MHVCFFDIILYCIVLYFICSFYFSKENLSSDTYLLSHMNVNRSVPLSLISQFPKVRHLTTDHDILISAIKTCKNCQPDQNDTHVKATTKIERTTLILRDLPHTISQQTIMAVFQVHACTCIHIYIFIYTFVFNMMNEYEDLTTV